MMNLKEKLEQAAGIADELTAQTFTRLEHQRARRAEIIAGVREMKQAMVQEINVLFASKMDALERMLLGDVDEVIRAEEAQLAMLRGKEPQPPRMATILGGKAASGGDGG